MILLISWYGDMRTWNLSTESPRILIAANMEATHRGDLPRMFFQYCSGSGPNQEFSEQFPLSSEHPLQWQSDKRRKLFIDGASLSRIKKKLNDRRFKSSSICWNQSAKGEMEINCEKISRGLRIITRKMYAIGICKLRGALTKLISLLSALGLRE